MVSEDVEIDKLILHLRAYKQLLRDPNISGLDSRDELEAKIKLLFVNLIGYSASLRDKEEAEKGKIDDRLKQLLNTRIGEKTMEEGHKAIKDEVDGLKRMIEAQSKNNQGEKAIKADLRQIDEDVNRLKEAVQYLSRKSANVKLVESEAMKKIDRLGSQLVTPSEENNDIYITYPPEGEKREVSVGTLMIDFFTGEVTLPNGNTERTSFRLENSDFEVVRSLSVDVNKAAILTLDSGGKYSVGANQLFSIERQKCRIVYMEFTEVANITLWASTNEEGAIRIEKPTTIDTDERRFTTAIEYNAADNPLYVGDAAAGTGKSESKWRIKKLIYSGSNVTDIQWASGSASFNVAWDDRTTYTYS